MASARSRPALRLAATSAVDLAAAIDAFLSQPDLASTTRAKYRQTLMVVEDELGDAPVTGAGLAGVVAQRWHHASPATWNRHVATVRSFARYCARTRILAIAGDVELQRRAEKHDHTRSIALGEPRAAVGAPRHRPARTHAVAACSTRPPPAPTRSCA